MKIIKKLSLLIVSIGLTVASFGQGAISYQLPPKEIANLLLAKPTPGVSIDSKGEWMLLSERNSYPTVEELGQTEIRIAGFV